MVEHARTLTSNCKRCVFTLQGDVSSSVTPPPLGPSQKPYRRDVAEERVRQLRTVVKSKKIYFQNLSLVGGVGGVGALRLSLRTEELLLSMVQNTSEAVSIFARESFEK